MKPDLEEIKANCHEVGDCWEWKGALDGSAPIMRLSGSQKTTPVRRWVLEQAGKMKAGQLVCSKCGNHLCVAPAHAVSMTRKEFQQRTAKTTRYGNSIARSKKISAARRSNGTVLTEAIVSEMREAGMSSRQAAKKYGCGQYAAWQALSGRTWKDYSNPFMGLMS